LAQTDEYTEDFHVHGVYFGVGDPEEAGHHWNFTRTTDEDDDEGVCTVREPQRAVLYGGIERFELHRDHVRCVFDGRGTQETGFTELEIRFELDDAEWAQVAEMLDRVFAGQAAYSRREG